MDTVERRSKMSAMTAPPSPVEQPISLGPSLKQPSTSTAPKKGHLVARTVFLCFVVTVLFVVPSFVLGLLASVAVQGEHGLRQQRGEQVAGWVLLLLGMGKEGGGGDGESPVSSLKLKSGFVGNQEASGGLPQSGQSALGRGERGFTITGTKWSSGKPRAAPFQSARRGKGTTGRVRRSTFAATAKPARSVQPGSNGGGIEAQHQKERRGQARGRKTKGRKGRAARGAAGQEEKRKPNEVKLSGSDRVRLRQEPVEEDKERHALPNAALPMNVRSAAAGAGEKPEGMNGSQSVVPRWEDVALTQILLTGTVEMALDLREQHVLLIVSLPCEASRLLEHMNAPRGSPQGVQLLTPRDIAAELPWQCIYNPRHPSYELAPVISVAAKGSLLFVGCREQEKKTRVRRTSVSLRFSNPEHVTDGVDVFKEWEHWYGETAGLNSFTGRQCLPSDIAGALQLAPSLGAHMEKGVWGAGAASPLVSQRRQLPSSVPLDKWFRFVVEAVPQNEGLYLFVLGLRWRNRTHGWLNLTALSCVFGRDWEAPALLGNKWTPTQLLCPYPPKNIREAWAKEGKGRCGGVQKEGESSSGCSIGFNRSVKVTLRTSKWLFPSVAFYDPSVPIPESWREEHRSRNCPQQTPLPLPKSSVEDAPEADARHTLCACTVIKDKAKFLTEWIMYHSWLGVEHFFLYDNNSEDNLVSLSKNLTQTVPHPNWWQHPYALRSASEVLTNQSSRELPLTVGVSVVPWPWFKSQEMGFSNCLLRAAPLCQWVMFTDVDEFVFPSAAEGMQNGTEVLRERLRTGPFMQHLLNRSVMLGSCKKRPVGQWLMDSFEVGPSGNLKNPEVGVAAGYTCRRSVHIYTKAIVRPEATNLYLQHRIHMFHANTGYRTILRSGIASPLKYYHFKFQTWDEYMTKFIRRVSRRVPDWTPGRAKGWDGVTFTNGVPQKPADWPQKFCDVRDENLAKLVKQVFARESASGDAYPWQGMFNGR